LLGLYPGYIPNDGQKLVEFIKSVDLETDPFITQWEFIEIIKTRS